MHCSEMRTAWLLIVCSVRGGGCRPPWMQTPSQMQTPRMQAPVDADLPGCRSPPGCRRPWMQTPLDADPSSECRPPWSCELCCMLGIQPSPQTNTCENFTLPQTLFAWGNNMKIGLPRNIWPHNNCNSGSYFGLWILLSKRHFLPFLFCRNAISMIKFYCFSIMFEKLVSVSFRLHGTINLSNHFKSLTCNRPDWCGS